MTCLILAPLAANAQMENDAKALRDSSKGGDASGDEGAQGQPEGTIEATPGGDKEGGNTSSHTVEKGDTLWDLSQKYLGSPWYWPKVWSYNPEIANPHWIYPGNVVKFVGSGEEVPTQVEVGKEPDEVEPGTIVEDEDRVSTAGKIGYTPKNGVHVRSPGFVTDKEIEESGIIFGSSAESNMLSFPQTVYLKFNKDGDAHLGGTYVVFRKGKEVLHPITGDRIGYQTVLLGTVKLNRIDKKLSVAQIGAAWDEIHRGDLIGPLNDDLSRRVLAKANDREAKGVVVSSMRTWQTVMGEHEFLIVDKGSEAGVQPGNTMTIVRQLEGNNPTATINPTQIEEGYPTEDMGTCMAIEVKNKVSVCILIRSLHEIVRGDRFEMRTGKGGPAASR
jgi:hypothetical protein